MIIRIKSYKTILVVNLLGRKGPAKSRAAESRRTLKRLRFQSQMRSTGVVPREPQEHMESIWFCLESGVDLHYLSGSLFSRTYSPSLEAPGNRREHPSDQKWHDLSTAIALDLWIDTEKHVFRVSCNDLTATSLRPHCDLTATSLDYW